jgi:hypothetical protein
MMQMHYFHEISRQVASNHRASEKAHSRKLGFRLISFSETHLPAYRVSSAGSLYPGLRLSPYYLPGSKAGASPSRLSILRLSL